MIRRCFSVVLYVLLANLAAPARADSEYWVSVGSYRSYEEAEAAREQAMTRLPESFSVAEAILDSGLWYRVLAGPYLTQEIAEHLVSEARGRGFSEPWVLVKEVDLVDPIDDYSDGLLASEPTFADEIDLESFDLDVPDEAPMDIPGFNVPIREDADRDHKLVDEAPPGYNLNRLRRN